jgi:Glycosyltransferase 61
MHGPGDRLWSIPLKSLIRRKLLRRSPSLSEVSSRSWTICPPEKTTVPAAIYLDAGLDRVAGVGRDTTRDNELRRVKGGLTEHAPTVAHEIRRAHLLQGSLYAGPWRWPLARGGRLLRWQGDCAFERSAALACTYYGSFYFGHWMRDDLPLALAAVGVDEPVAIDRAAYRHEPGYRELLGIHTPAHMACAFDRIVVLEDFSQNTFKRKRYEELRARLAARIPDSASQRVYLRRGAVGAQGARVLINGEQVESLLIAQGFAVVDPDLLSAGEICRHLRGASMVVSVEGSHLAHVIYTMAGDGVICVLQPPYRFNNVYKDYADCAGMRYAFVTGVAGDGGFAIPTDDLARTLEKVERECRLTI